MEEKKTLAIFEPLMNGVKANLDGLFCRIKNFRTRNSATIKWGEV
jgi:hypothetical protein